MEAMQTLLSLLGVNAEGFNGEEAYIKAVDTFLKGQDFMRLGRCIQGRQWHLVMSNSARMKTHCSELGITCFDSYLAGIRAAARRQDVSEALQLMSRITAKRVQIRNLLAEEKYKCDM